MRNRSDMTSWSLLKEAFTDIPNNATVILAALMLTGLAASMVLARHATDVGVSDGIHTRVYPARVFRSPIRRSWPRTGSGGTDVGWPVLDGADQVVERDGQHASRGS